jgi:molybdenum cofactor cytidylyltransferase
MTQESQKSSVAAVLLAAGESSRMGESKALLPWKARPTLIEYQVRALDQAGYAPIIVVLGHDAVNVQIALPDDVETSVIFNQYFTQGRTSSIIAGVLPLAGISTGGVGAVLLTNVDQPRTVPMLRALREAWEEQHPPIIVPTLDGKPGHPSLFDAALIPELAQLTEKSEGLRKVMSNHYEERVLVPVSDPLTLTNLNTREDYEKALKLV